MNHYNKVPPCHLCPSRGDSVFCNLDTEALVTLNAAKSYSLYKRGQEVFSEGSPAFGVYCVYSGKIRLHRTFSGQEQITGFAGKGSFLGFRAVYTKQNFTETATAAEDAMVCFFPAEAITAALFSNPEFAEENFRLLTRSLSAGDKKLAVVSGKRAQGRLASVLRMLYSYYKSEEKPDLINIRITRAELANMSGMTQETAIRILSALKKSGIVALEGRAIRIIDHDRLKHIAADRPEIPVLYHGTG